MQARTLEVRGRLPAALVGLGVFILLGRWCDPEFFSSTTFGIAVGTAVSATLLEPFFTRPQDALLNGAGGIVAYFAIERSPENDLWTGYVLFVTAVICGALAAILIRDDSSLVKWLGRRFATTFGRAVVIGPSALMLDALNRAARGEKNLAVLVGAIAVLTASVAVNWARLLRRIVVAGVETATAIAAVGPRMLLTSATHGALEPGVPVEVVGEGRVHGTIIARLPHQHGARYQVALESDWSRLCPSFPAEVEIHVRDEPSQIIGSVGEGSTDVTIEFGPLRPLRIGAPIALHSPDGALLYQIASLRLQMREWAGASSVVPHATARQIGLPRNGFVVAVDYLPDPHEPVIEIGELISQLPGEFFRIGRVKGTEVPIGIRRSYLDRGHLAVLGMSGMGKTAAADRIARSLGDTELAVVLDLTGEYSRRLGFPSWQGNLDAVGHSVLEPVGDPPTQAATLVNQLMQKAGAEYNAGQAPPARTVLFEEAHSFVPEWNFATPGQQSRVNDTTRLIMQARKYGLRFVIVSQRTAVVSKSALSQCDNYIVFRTIDHTGLEYVETLAGTAFRHTISTLKKYEALCMGPAFNSDQPVIVELDPPDLPRPPIVPPEEDAVADAHGAE